MDLRTTVTSIGATPVVEVEGIVDLAAVGVLRDTLARTLRARRGETVIVDLDGVTAIDDGGLGVLLGAAAAARDHDGDLRLLASTPTMRTRLAHTRLDRAIDVLESMTR
jgi:anti-anti-sigma factor